MGFGKQVTWGLRPNPSVKRRIIERMRKKDEEAARTIARLEESVRKQNDVLGDLFGEEIVGW